MNFDTILNQYIIPWGINIGIAIAIFIAGKIAIKLIMKITEKMFEKSKVEKTLSNFFQAIIKAVLIVFLVIVILDRLGISTTSFVAILGAAGLAVGLALKDSLHNFASGTMLIIFSPFKIGDVIEAAGVTGIVEHITIFTTVLKTADNQKIIIPNGAISSGKIVNVSPFETRRIDISITLSHLNNIQDVKNLISSILSEDSRVLKNPEFAVLVGDLTAANMTILIRPWVKSENYLNVKSDVLEKIKKAFDDGKLIK